MIIVEAITRITTASITSNRVKPDLDLRLILFIISIRPSVYVLSAAAALDAAALTTCTLPVFPKPNSDILASLDIIFT
jgi:hypothetical protein